MADHRGQQGRAQQPSIVGFVILAGLVVLVAGYLGWRVYNAPADPTGAGLVATQATEVTVRAGGGDPSVCAAMRDLAIPGDEQGAVARCQQVAAQAVDNGVPALDVSNLQVTETEVDRNSGHVTVAGTLNTPAGASTMRWTWQLERQDGSWRLSGDKGPTVEVE